MFADLDAGERSRVPLRHQCADRAGGGADRCRPVTSPPTRRARHAAVREAGALALTTFRGAAQALDQGRGVAGLRGRHRGRRLLRERLLGAIPATAGCPRRRSTIRAAASADAVWIVDPIDGTRAYIAGRARLVDLGGAGRRRPAGSPPLFAPVTEEMFVAVAGEGATRNGAPIGQPAPGFDGAQLAGPALPGRSSAASRPVPLPKIHSLALRLARVAHGALDVALRRQQPRLGPCGGRPFGARSRRRDDHFDGEPLIYNRPSPCMARWSRAGRAHHARVIELVRGRQHEFARSTPMA